MKETGAYSVLSSLCTIYALKISLSVFVFSTITIICTDTNLYFDNIEFWDS